MKLRCVLANVTVILSVLSLTLTPAGAEQKSENTAEKAVYYMPFGARSSLSNEPLEDLASGYEVEWLKERGERQLRTRYRFNVFHEFRFADKYPDSQGTFQHKICDDVGKYYKPVHYDHGNGLAVADVDGDGLHDIYFLTQLGANELWKNLGNGKFRNITESAGVGLADRLSVTASFADIDNDGDQDLFVTTVKMGNVLFENLGLGQFKDITVNAGVGHVGHSSGAVFFDYDRDGLLDLFVTNVGVYTTDQQGAGGYYVGLDMAFSGHLYPDRSERSILYKNLGKNRFQDVSEQLGLVDTSWSGDATSVDLNSDGWTDLYVLNMQGNDHYYENVEGKKFVDRTDQYFPNTSWGAMGVKFFDYNNDGFLDLFVTDMHSDMSDFIDYDFPLREKLKSIMQFEESYLVGHEKSIWGNTFYKNEGEGKFTEVSNSIGVENYWPWGLSVGDLNSDGFPDIFITSSMNYPYRYGVNSLLLNNRGETFLDSEFILGVEPRRGGVTIKPWYDLDCSVDDKEHARCEGNEGTLTVMAAYGSRASVIFDLDQDGDLDIVTNELNAEPQIFVSNLDEVRDINFIKIDLVGKKSNRDGLGARVTVETSGGEKFTQVQDGKCGYLSQCTLPLYFGLGESGDILNVKVYWPSGHEQTVKEGVELNQTLRIVEDGSQFPKD